jgi:hypothetical protein
LQYFHSLRQIISQFPTHTLFESNFISIITIITMLFNLAILLTAMPVSFAMQQPPPPGGDGGGGGGGGPPPPAPDDLLIRFSKIVFPLDSSLYDTVLPLGPEDYPVRGALADTLKFDSIAHSVMTRDDFEVNNVDLASYIQAIGGRPSFPSSDSSADFWEEFMEVLEIQEARISGTVPTANLMVLPDIWAGKSLHDVADAVHDEYPASHHVELMKTFFGEGLELDYSILPFRSNRDFIGLEVRMADLVTWAFAAVAPTNFLMKWSVGRPRPEEIAIQIKNDDITELDGVPSGVVAAVKAMGLTRAENFTHYDEGCPLHPSWPAMHSASSAASLWLAVVADLTPDQYCQVLRTDYAVSFARTVAGVHYTTDNIAGLNLGQKILADKLAGHLAEKYGADPQVVQQKINSLTFDWNDFNPVTCAMDNN